MTMRNLFKKKMLLILLDNYLTPGKVELTKYRIAKIVGCHPTWAVKFVKQLEKEKLVKGTKVINVRGLIEFYGKTFKRPKYKEFAAPNPEKLLSLLKKTKLEYAITTYFAENLVQKYLFPSRLDLYIREEDFTAWRDLLVKANALVGKGNVRLYLAREPVFFKAFKRKGLSLVSLPQLIVDLLDEGGPAIEAAEMLLKRLKANV